MNVLTGSKDILQFLLTRAESSGLEDCVVTLDMSDSGFVLILVSRLEEQEQ